MWTVIKAQWRLLYRYYLVLIPVMIYFSMNDGFESSKTFTMLALYIGFMSGNGQAGYSDAFILTNLPVSRNNILFGKYLFSVSMSIVIFAFTFLGINHFSEVDLINSLDIDKIIYYFLLLGFMSTFTIPFSFKFSQRKAMLLSMLISISLIVAIMLVTMHLLPTTASWKQNYVLWNKIFSGCFLLSLMSGIWWSKNILKNGVVIR